ncbi:MAG: rhomboid family intramembrane serine protease [Erysipelotrichaceae bacterium]|nr:rhomboid family intramembrane serine protease [Erysipelotrichaceae bacterium]
MNRNELYKCYQILEYLVSNFSYVSLSLMGINTDNEIWLVDKDSPYYQLIRITNAPYQRSREEAEKLNAVTDLVKKRFFLKKLDFLDIRVSHEEIDVETKYDTACIDTGFHSGKDLSGIFPGIYQVIHDSENGEKEIIGMINSINARLKENKTIQNKKPLLKKISSFPYLVTYSLIILSLIMFLTVYLFSKKYSYTASLIYLGADYKMFTLGLGEYWRLFTCSLLHSSLTHLLCNTFSLFVLGSILEGELGRVRFLIMFVAGVLCASLTHGVLSGNSLVVGLSGGIYALFAFYLIKYLQSGMVTIRQMWPTLFLNIVLNFLPNVSWQAHLGGALIGLIFYYIYEEDRINWAVVPLVVILIGGLFFKYQRDHYLKPYYASTDYEVIDLMIDKGKINKANVMTEKLNRIYLDIE